MYCAPISNKIEPKKWQGRVMLEKIKNCLPSTIILYVVKKVFPSIFQHTHLPFAKDFIKTTLELKQNFTKA